MNQHGQYGINFITHPDTRPKPRDWDGRRLSVYTRCEVKEDGYRMTIYMRPGEQPRLIGRQTHINLLHNVKNNNANPFSWEVAMERVKEGLGTTKEEGCIIDGELYAPGENATRVASYLAKDCSKLKFTPFAVRMWKGKIITTFEESDNIIDASLSSSSGVFTRLHVIKDWMTFIPEKSTKEQAVETMKEVARDFGIEGFVLKEEFYGKLWWKVKKASTADLIVMDTLPGVGKHKDRHGSMICGVYDETGKLLQVSRVGKGCDPEWRDTPTKDLVGRVCEVSHEGMQARGMLKFSSFLRWRDDKPASECLLSLLIQ